MGHIESVRNFAFFAENSSEVNTQEAEHKRRVSATIAHHVLHALASAAADAASGSPAPHFFGASHSDASVSDPWSGVNWPDDGDSDDPSFDSFDPSVYNSDGSLRPINDPMGEGILQQLQKMLYDLKQYSSNSGMEWPKMIEFIGNIAGNSTLANDPTIQSFFANNTVFGISPLTGQATDLGTFLIDSVVAQAWGNELINGGNLNDAKYVAQQLAGQLYGAFSSLGITQGSFADSMFQEAANICLLPDPDFLNTLYNKFYAPFGRIGYAYEAGYPIYFSSDVTGERGWMQCLNGMMGTYIAGSPDGTTPPSNLGATDNAAFYAIFNYLVKHLHDVGILLEMLFIALGMTMDQNDQSQLGGLGMSSKFLTGMTDDVSQLITTFSAGFDPQNPQSAMNWMESVQLLYSDAVNKGSYIDSGFLSTIKSVVDGIDIAPQNPGGIGTTLGYLFQSGDGADLARGLNSYLWSSTSAANDTLLDSLNTGSKTASDRSQTVGTATSGVTQKDNQIVNTMNTGLNDTSSGLIAPEHTAVTNQISK